MRILLSAIAATLIATAASAGGTGGATSDATVMTPNGGGSCHTVLVTGKDYCIGGVIYPG